MGLKVQLESALNGSETAAGMTLEMADYGPLKLKRSKRDCVAFKVEQTPLSILFFRRRARGRSRGRARERRREKKGVAGGRRKNAWTRN